MEHIVEVRAHLDYRFGIEAIEDSLIYIFYLEGYRYISRDGDGLLWVSESNLVKGPLCWHFSENGKVKCVANIGQYLFESIKWEDEEPFSIDSYIGENLLCEDNIK